MGAGYAELGRDAPYPQDLARRVMSGEIFVARGCMQRVGIFEELRAASLEGIRRVAGPELAQRVGDSGFDAIHELADLARIARITDATYELVAERCQAWVSAIASRVFHVSGPFYFEREPNVRYVIPYDLMTRNREVVESFARDHGTGKLSPHPCHRDSWVDCPDNLINVWVAVGPIPEGNGLALYPEVYGKPLRHLASGSIARDESPGAPLCFDLQPGDAILFRGDHLHASVLNRTDRTRHAVSFRIVTRRPHFPNGHYHHYAHSSLAGGPLDAFAELPANLSPSWLQTRLRWVAERLGLRSTAKGRSGSAPRAGSATGAEHSFDLAALPANSLHPVSEKVCLARIGDEQLVAFDRRCPHDGGDLARGSIANGQIVCPWHNLRFDPRSGASACKSLRRLRLYETRVRDGRVTIAADPL